MITIEFFYDFGSPNAYLVHKVLPELAKRTGVKLRYVPVLLGGVFQATNNQSPMQAFAEVKNKLAYQTLEIQRFVKRHDLKFAWNPNFPVMTLEIMRGAVYAQGKPWEADYIDAVFDAMWVDRQKMDTTSVIETVLNDAGLPAQEIVAATVSPQVKIGLINNTSTAVDRGAFGAPTMFVGEQMFFGKDALIDLEYELSQSASDRLR